jgi:hypothetical protein
MGLFVAFSQRSRYQKRGVKTGIYLILSVTLAAAALLPVRACDLCGCYTPQLEVMPGMEPGASKSRSNGFYGAISEQFTHFGTVLENGREVSNPTGQYENSSITQLIAGYTINDRFGLQLNIPLIDREFKRPEGFAIDRGTVSGLGDISLMLQTVAFRYSSGARKEFDVSGKNPVAIEREPDFAVSVVLLTGLKLPTGDSGRLKEEFHEHDVPGAAPNGIHGHDLTLGTGSYDGLFGETTSLRYKGFFAEANVQFTLRGDGLHQYHFANDIQWDGGPGYYVVRNRETIVGLQFIVSGEHKDVDRFRGAPATDTGITSVFVGPRMVASYRRWSAQVEVDLPVLIENTARQVVSDYRLRGGISFQF